jgi:hypothetical protein
MLDMGCPACVSITAMSESAPERINNDLLRRLRMLHRTLEVLLATLIVYSPIK